MAIPWKPVVTCQLVYNSCGPYPEGVMHYTKDKGDLGVFKAQVDLFEQGFTILSPMTEHAPFDLVAYKNSNFYRIQVKYRKPDTTGKLDIKLSTCGTDRTGTPTVPIDKGEIDLFCVYCPDTDECYYFIPGKFGPHISLRVKTPKNGQKKNIRFASDYRRVP